ncbi:MAG: response regulator transcription factor [Candidatus Latescibacteria bacterium]|nr:response regulator transcription factor [Candidatus Latescibacterota bacterium]
MIKILIVDDHPIVRKGMRQILSEVDDIQITDEADKACDVPVKIRQQHFDVVLLDISLPDVNGLEVLKQIKYEKPDLPVLILSTYPEEQYAVRTLKAGAAGYLTKDKAPGELINAIRKVSVGRKYISSYVAEKLADELYKDSGKLPHETLSDREYQILTLIAEGKTCNEIADMLSLSNKTVATYRSRILEKMDMKNNADIIRYALHNHIIE